MGSDGSPLRAVALLALGLAGLVACSPKPAAEAAKSALVATGAVAGLTGNSTVADVHAALIRPGSDRLYAAESDTPASDAAWKDVETAAQKVIDGAGLLSTGSRKRDDGDWVRLSKAVAENARKSLTAAQGKNADALAEADGSFTGYCEDCHKTYRDAGKGMMSQPDK